MIYEVSRDGDTSSSCEECKLENANGAINLNQSSSEEEVLIQGIDSLSQNRQQHLQHLQHPSSSPALHHQHMIHRLQEENKHLKLMNQQNEREVMELRYEIEMSRVRPFVEDQRKSMGNTNTFVRMQTLPGQITPKTMGRVMSPDFRDRKGASGAITGAGGTRFSEMGPAVGSNARNGPNAESMLQVVQLQKQVKELQLKLLQLTNKLHQSEQHQTWMHKFIISFINMAEELSVNYGVKLQVRGLPLRKKTKECWKYLKGLVGYLIKP